MGSGPDYHVDDTDSIDSASNRQDTESQDSSNNDSNVASDPAADAAADTAFMQQFASFIDPDVDDPFCPSLFDEESMQFVHPRKEFYGALHPSLLAQVDLFRLLQRSGCSLHMHDKIINWVLHYSQKEVSGNIWLDHTMYSRKKLIEKISSHFDMGGYKPVMKTVISPYDNRPISVPVFSFVQQAMSLLSSDLLSPESLIDGYDLFTGKCGDHFWDPGTINTEDSMAIPTPLDKHRNTSDVHSSYLFQSAVSRFCTEPHHVPVPIIIGYDKANLSRQGDLALAPLIFTFGFFKSRWRHKSKYWRNLGYMPNLAVGVNKCASADEKAIDHYLCLREILKEMEDVCSRGGGFKTRIKGKTVVLNFFCSLLLGMLKVTTISVHTTGRTSAVVVCVLVNSCLNLIQTNVFLSP